MKNRIEEILILNGKLVAKRCKKSWFEKYGVSDFYNKIITSTSFLGDVGFPQRVWHIYHNIFEKPKCKNPHCNNHTTFTTFTRGYLDTCSPHCAQLNPSTINSIKTTNFQKYGTAYGLSNVNIIKKRKNTLFKNYGVDNPTKSVKVLNGIARRNKKKYGVEWILGDQQKKESAIFQKYGVKNIQQRKDICERTSKTRRAVFYDCLFNTDRLNGKVLPLFTKDEYVNGGLYKDYQFECVKCKTVFFDCLEDGDIPRCTTCYKGSSIFEKEVSEYVRSVLPTNEVILENDKVVLDGKLELDIFVPRLKIAIECDGLFWHGEINGNKDKNYHLNKTQICAIKGIRLIHIFEDEWLFKRKIVESRLRNIFQKTHHKIYARKCTIREASPKECGKFLSTHHIQGNDRSSIKLGLYNGGELISVMTFGKLRRILGNKSHGTDIYEMYRFCHKSDVYVVGGASKLLSYFIKMYKPTKIISYADRRWSNNDSTLYDKLGFMKVSDGVSNYWYFGRGNSYKRHHRFAFAKHTLKTRLKFFDPELSEWENMKNNGWDRIWDCGNFKYELKV